MRLRAMLPVLAATCLVFSATARGDAPNYVIGLKGTEHAAGGIAVQDVRADGPAERAGIVAGDVLIQLDGETLDEMQQLHAGINESAGRPLRLALLRKGRPRVVTVHPAPASDPAPPRRDAGQATRGSGGNGLADLLKSLPLGDLLNLDSLEIEIRRRGPSDSLRSQQLPPSWNRDQDAITIYGRIQLGQLLSGFWSGGDEEELRRLERRVEQLQAEVDQLKRRLEER